jgi:hypothetical protein
MVWESEGTVANSVDEGNKAPYSLSGAAFLENLHYFSRRIPLHEFSLLDVYMHCLNYWFILK